MTVHMFRCYIGRGKMSVSDLETRINDWVSSNAEWTADTTPHTLTERTAELDESGATFYAIDVRFLKDDTKDNLLQKFTDKLVNKVDWYRIGYHECSHDERAPTACDWQDTTEWAAKDVTVPSGIPTIEVTV
jgi:hypothetical protein